MVIMKYELEIMWKKVILVVFLSSYPRAFLEGLSNTTNTRNQDIRFPGQNTN
jgi:hypothetical protein